MFSVGTARSAPGEKGPLLGAPGLGAREAADCAAGAALRAATEFGMAPAERPFGASGGRRGEVGGSGGVEQGS